MLAALRAFACSACFQYSCRDGDGKEPRNGQNQSYRRAAVTFVRVVYHTSVKTGAYGTNAGHHTGVPVTVFQVRNLSRV